MPKNQVSDPITDQEIAFAHLILSGTMTDRPCRLVFYAFCVIEEALNRTYGGNHSLV